jgi:hypothetical protein
MEFQLSLDFSNENKKGIVMIPFPIGFPRYIYDVSF